MPRRGGGLGVATAVLLALFGAGAAARAGDPERGAYVFAAAGCQGCHTDAKNGGALLAGGRALKTPFGVFYGPNITPDPKTGIGAWSDEDFIRALRHGLSPSGSHYYPAFPYTSFTRMAEQDMRDLKTYIFTLPPVEAPNRPHDLRFPFGWRPLVGLWKWLNFDPGPFRPALNAGEEVSRGAYLVRALGHCGECHTPRDLLGGPDESRHLAGTGAGPEGGKIPNITPDPKTGIGAWSVVDLTFLLQTGLDPTGDSVGSGMGEVVQNSTSRLTDADRKAIAVYLKSLPPIENAAFAGRPQASSQPSSDW